MSRRALAAAALAAALSRAPTAGAYCRTTTVPAQPDPTVCPSRGVPVAWPGSCVGFRIDPTVLAEGIDLETFRGIAVASARAWSSVDCGGGASPSFELLFLDDFASPAGWFSDRPNVNTLAFREAWGDDVFHPPDAAAVTIVTFRERSAVMVDTDTDLNLRGPNNPSGFRFSTTGDPTSADLQTVVTHELGHAQGLAHSASRSAVMWYSAGRGEQRRAPTDDDTAGICAVYPPGRVAECVPERGAVSLGGGGLTCASRPSRGGPRGACLALFAALALAVSARRRG